AAVHRHAGGHREIEAPGRRRDRVPVEAAERTSRRGARAYGSREPLARAEEVAADDHAIRPPAEIARSQLRIAVKSARRQHDRRRVDLGEAVRALDAYAPDTAPLIQAQVAQACLCPDRAAVRDES